MNATAYRLNGHDESRIRARLRAVYDDHGQPRLTTDIIESYERIAAHAIGCSVFDLRDSEREWIAHEIGELALSR